MLSSNRTINIFNTLRGKVSPEAKAKLCLDKFYVTTDSIRKICKAGNPNYKWMEELLHLEARSDIQHTPELPTLCAIESPSLSSAAEDEVSSSNKRKTSTARSMVKCAARSGTQPKLTPLVPRQVYIPGYRILLKLTRH